MPNRRRPARGFVERARATPEPAAGVIDSHCHLAGREFAEDLQDVVARAQNAGVVRCLVILAAENDEEIDQAQTVLLAWPAARFAIGVHPHQAHVFADKPEAAAGLTANRMDMLPSACAIGEIGLDYHYDYSPRDVQQAVFRAQLRLAVARGRPVVIHSREAEADTLQIISEESRDRLRGVFHCFSGDAAAVRRALQTGFYVSLPGILTFPKAEALRDAARLIPLDRLLIETDSPYLSPLPYRGKRNEPAYVIQVLEQLAAVRSMDRGQLGAALFRNFDTLFEPVPQAFADE
jgi:TatD DNase family protein